LYWYSIRANVALLSSSCYLAIFQHQRQHQQHKQEEKKQQKQQTHIFPFTAHWEELIHYPNSDISDYKGMQHYIDFLEELESENMLTHFPQETLSIICRHMVTDLKTSTSADIEAYHRNSRELLINLSQQSVKTKQKSFIIESVNLAVFIFRSIDSGVETVLIENKIQAEIQRQPRLKRIVQP
jgi:type II secretory pathway component PulL